MTFRKSDILPILSAVVLATLMLGLAACGKRDWPEPRLSEDRYRIRTVNVTRAQGCIVVDMELAGAWQNLENLRLLVEPIGGQDGGCADCPFQPTVSRFFGPGASEVKRSMNRLVITSCGFDAARTYRVQVVGSNIYPQLSLVMSDVKTVAPQ